MVVALGLGQVAHAQDKRANDALGAWVLQWQKGKLDMTKPRITKSAIGVRAGFVDPGAVGGTTHQKELVAICDAVAKADCAEAVDALLEVAAIGLDASQRLEVEQRPDAVRRVGELALDRLRSADAITALEACALEVTKGRDVLRRAAALRALGRRNEERFFAPLEAALADREIAVRLAASEASQVTQLRALMKPLATALREETDSGVMAAATDALRAILLRHKEQAPEDELKRAVDGAIHALGRGDWRSDFAAVEFLEIARSAQSVPPLIEVLVRQVPPEGKESARQKELRSGVLRERTWDVLVSLTGARFPKEDPGAWQRWWDKTRDQFTVAEIDEKKVEAGVTSDGSSFFGIPVRGSRVLFIVDTSGSMLETMRAGSTTSAQGGGRSKMEAAKDELVQVVEKLTADCAFNLVWFSNGAELWSKDMVEATPANKKKFTKAVDGLRADGGTNLWEGLRDGLKVEAFGHGALYGARYDEVFILSDGIPTLGDVRDPKELLSLVDETNRYSRVVINTIYIAGDPESERKAQREVGMSGADFMRKMAEANGGRNVTL